MSFLADDDLILKHSKIWKKIKNLLSVELDSQPIYSENQSRTFEDKVITKLKYNHVLLQFVLIL